MLKQICKIIKNDLRSNLLLIAGMFVIAASLWYAVDYVYAQTKNMIQPIGFDWRNVYYVQVGVLPQESKDYDATPKDIDATTAEYMEFYDRIKRHPAVESACYTRMHFHYMWKNSNTAVYRDSLGVYAYHRIVSPSYFEAFGVNGADGCSPQELSRRAAAEPGVVLSEDLARYLMNGVKWDEPAKHSATEIVGTDIVTENKENPPVKVLALCERQKYNEFNFYNSALYDINSNLRVNYNSIPYIDMFIRVKPDADGTQFMESFRREMKKQLRVGNLYLADMKPMSLQRKEHLSEYRSELYMHYSIAAFFLVNAFLAILGTFWFRTQQRTGELAIRLAFGATPRNLMTMLMLEGILLVTVAYLPAIAIGYGLGKGEVLTRYWEWNNARLLVSSLLTYLLLVAVTVFSIWFPARRAMKIQVVEALHGE